MVLALIKQRWWTFLICTFSNLHLLLWSTSDPNIRSPTHPLQEIFPSLPCPSQSLTCSLSCYNVTYLNLLDLMHLSYLFLSSAAHIVAAPICSLFNVQYLSRLALFHKTGNLLPSHLFVKEVKNTIWTGTSSSPLCKTLPNLCKIHERHISIQLTTLLEHNHIPNLT